MNPAWQKGSLGRVVQVRQVHSEMSRAMPERALNVLSVVPDLHFAGGETRLLNIARSIDRRRVKLTVLTIYAPQAKLDARFGSMRFEFSDAGIDVLNLGVRRADGRRRPRMVQLARTAKILGTAIVKLRQVIASLGIDVVDAHLDPSLLTAVPAAALAGVPSSITLYNELRILGIAPGSGRQRSFQGSLRRLALRLAGLVLTDSRSTATDLARFIGSPVPQMRIVPNGVHLPAPRRSRAEVLADFGIPGDTRARIIGQVSRLVEYKGHRILLEAAKQILDQGENVYVLCVGHPSGPDPTYAESLRQQAERLGISDRVRIRGYPGCIADVWNVIDLHVHASLLDSTPNAIIEGMSLRKPVVATSVGGIPDQVKDGQTGLLVPPRDAKALADAALRLLRDDVLAARLGQAAHRRYLRRYAPEVTTRQIEACFRDLARGGRRGFFKPSFSGLDQVDAQES